MSSQRYGQGNRSQHQQRSHDRTGTSHDTLPQRKRRSRSVMEADAKMAAFEASRAAKWVWHLNIKGFRWCFSHIHWFYYHFVTTGRPIFRSVELDSTTNYAPILSPCPHTRPCRMAKFFSITSAGSQPIS